MIRIVGVQRDPDPRKEFVVLQNQGNMRAPLRGHALATAQAVSASDPCRGVHIFPDDEDILPGKYVLLHTGSGEPGWVKCSDGSLAYRTYIGSRSAVWNNFPGPLHLLAPQHTYAERAAELLAI